MESRLLPYNIFSNMKSAFLRGGLFFYWIKTRSFFPLFALHGSQLQSGLGLRKEWLLDFDFSGFRGVRFLSLSIFLSLTCSTTTTSLSCTYMNQNFTLKWSQHSLRLDFSDDTFYIKTKNERRKWVKPYIAKASNLCHMDIISAAHLVFVQEPVRVNR